MFAIAALFVPTEITEPDTNVAVTLKVCAPVDRPVSLSLPCHASDPVAPIAPIVRDRPDTDPIFITIVACPVTPPEWVSVIARDIRACVAHVGTVRVPMVNQSAVPAPGVDRVPDGTNAMKSLPWLIWFAIAFWFDDGNVALAARTGIVNDSPQNANTAGPSNVETSSWNRGPGLSAAVTSNTT